ncbi:MAG: hypothetical protein WEC59_06600, partial [Salibacteraceae bacterium]
METFIIIVSLLTISIISVLLMMRFRAALLVNLPYWIIPINVAADVLIGYFPKNTLLNTGELRVALLLPFVVYYFSVYF